MEYNELKNKLNRLVQERNEIMNDCAKEGLPFSKYMEKVTNVCTNIYLVEQEMRLFQTPTMEYGKKWKGVSYEIDKFIRMCNENTLNDEMGEGYYATENAKSDVRIYASDVLENVYRKDFSHVIWFNN